MARKKKVVKLEVRPDYVALEGCTPIPIYKFSPDRTKYTVEPDGDWIELKDRGLLIVRGPNIGKFLTEKQLRFLYDCTREMMIEQKKKPKTKRNGCYYMEKAWPIKEWLGHEAKREELEK